MKQDRKEIAAKQRHEIYYITKQWGIPKEEVKAAVEKTKSRVIVYALLRMKGYVIPGQHPKRLQKRIDQLAKELNIA